MLAAILIELGMTFLAVRVALWRGASWRSALLLLLIPAPAFFLMIWGAIFAAKDNMPPQHAPWVTDVVQAQFWSTPVIGLLVVAIAKNSRVPAAIFTLLQTPMTIFIAFITMMVVTGVFL